MVCGLNTPMAERTLFFQGNAFFAEILSCWEDIFCESPHEILHLVGNLDFPYLLPNFVMTQFTGAKLGLFLLFTGYVVG